MNINFTLIAQAIAFAILIWFTVKYVWPPLLYSIKKRKKISYRVVRDVGIFSAGIFR